MLPLAGLVVCFSPREPEDVGEEALGEAMPPHDLLGEGATLGAEADLPVDLDQAFVLEALDHL